MSSITAEDPAEGTKEGSWVIVAAAFVVSLCTRAMTRSLSVLLVEFSHHLDQDLATTAWIISINDCLTMLCAPLGTFFVSCFGYRLTVMFGGILSSSGYVLGSFCTNVVQLYICLGFLSGLGCALCFSPTVALIGLHFPRRCSMTTGLAMSGNGVGTFILAPISQILVEVYTWRGDLLILGGLMAHTCICAAFLRPPPSPPSSPATQPCNLFGGNKTREVKAHNLCSKFPSWHWNADSPLFYHEFILYIVAVSLLSYGCITPLLFIVTYAQENGVPDRHSAFLLSIIGILTIVGNVTYSWLMDSKCLSCYRVHAFAPIVCLFALNVLLLPVSASYTFLIFCTVLFGYCNGASTIVIPIVAAKLVGPKRAPTAISLVYFSHAIPYLIAPPISGWLISVTNGYTVPFLLSGFIILFSAVIFQISLVVAECWNGRSYSPAIFTCNSISRECHIELEPQYQM